MVRRGRICTLNEDFAHFDSNLLSINQKLTFNEIALNAYTEHLPTPRCEISAAIELVLTIRRRNEVHRGYITSPHVARPGSEGYHGEVPEVTWVCSPHYELYSIY